VSNLAAARLQMAVSLGFHILFAVTGIAMPLMMAIAEHRWLRTGDDVWLLLARSWARGTAILFAVGAVSGTVLSFELGLLWPRFMAFAGPIFGLPFAFFTEAIFLGVFLYGFGRVPPRLHWWSGVIVAVSGAVSGLFVVTANGWMNTPAGFAMVGGRPVDIDPIAAMLNPAALGEAVHMLIAAYAAVGLGVAGIHAFMLLRDPGSVFHKRAMAIALAIGGTASLLQPVSGDVLARQVAATQPVKLASMEGQFQTERGAPLRVGGVPDSEARVTRYALEIPKGLSLLAYHDPNALVRGLEEFPRGDWPPVPVVHFGFQIMVACGSAMALVALVGAWLAFRSRDVPDARWYLRLLIACAPLGFIAIEAGWTVTEVGRQPWIIQGLMRTADALTPMPGLIVPLIAVSSLYLLLGSVVLVLLHRQVWGSRAVAPVER
jgi:cytochrome d ubiquinol oxidase subunit I